MEVDMRERKGQRRRGVAVVLKRDLGFHFKT